MLPNFQIAPHQIYNNGTRIPYLPINFVSSSHHLQEPTLLRKALAPLKWSQSNNPETNIKRSFFFVNKPQPTHRSYHVVPLIAKHFKERIFSKRLKKSHISIFPTFHSAEFPINKECLRVIHVNSISAATGSSSKVLKAFHSDWLIGCEQTDLDFRCAWESSKLWRGIVINVLW